MIRESCCVVPGSGREKMSQIEQDCADILQDAKLSDDRKKSFCSYVSGLEIKTRHARYAYPLLYLLCGIAVYALFVSPHLTEDNKSKFITGLLGCFSAFLALYKPSYQIKQADCLTHLGIKLAGSD